MAALRSFWFWLGVTFAASMAGWIMWDALILDNFFWVYPLSAAPALAACSCDGRKTAVSVIFGGAAWSLLATGLAWFCDFFVVVFAGDAFNGHRDFGWDWGVALLPVAAGGFLGLLCMALALLQRRSRPEPPAPPP